MKQETNRRLVAKYYNSAKDTHKCVKCGYPVEPWRVFKSGRLKTKCSSCAYKQKLQRCGVSLEY